MALATGAVVSGVESVRPAASAVGSIHVMPTLRHFSVSAHLPGLADHQLQLLNPLGFAILFGQSGDEVG
jgi:hypothetical protein